MIASLVAIKLALGITSSAEDAALTQYEAQAAAWVESETHRRFEAPQTRTEYLRGTGDRTLYLSGHVGSGSVVVREQFGASGSESFTDFDQRGDSLHRNDGSCWSTRAEYEVTYNDGYTTAPKDIQAVVIELVRIQRSSATTTAGVTKMKLDGYEETYDLGAQAAAQSLAATSLRTLNNYRSMLV